MRTRPTTSFSLLALALLAPALAACGGNSAGGGDPNAQICVDHINSLRAKIGLAAYARWTDGEACAGQEAQSDSASGKPHGAFGTCGEHAQDECPGWPGPEGTMIVSCLDMMWAEGPGTDFSTHGHYINMSSTSYSEVACGFYTLPDGSIWAAQNFK